VSIIAALGATSGSVAAECLRYGDVSLTGRLMQQVYAGPPDFESVTKGDKPIVIWILLLENGICVRDGDASFPRAISEREIQLVSDTDRYRHLVGKNIFVAGKLLPSNGKYEKRFVLVPRDIRPD
jgi:hypothetical protein